MASKVPFPHKGITLADLPHLMAVIATWANEVNPARGLPQVLAGVLSHLNEMDDRVANAWIALASKGIK
jgi:hypothetical protein